MKDWAEVTLLILKFVALLLGGAFAVIGLLTDYRDKKGGVTRWGKTALLGIVLTSIIAFGIEATESYVEAKRRRANDEANRKSELQTQIVLSEIKRAVYPLRSVSLKKFKIIYPAKTQPLSDFLKQFPTPNPGGPDDFDFWSDRSVNLERWGTRPHSRGVGCLLDPRLEVRLWKKGVDMLQAPDLKFDVRVGNRVYMWLDTEKVNLWSKSPIPIPDDHLILSSGMASLEDMRGSKVSVTISIDGISEEARESYRELLQKSDVRDFTLSIANHEITARLENRESFAEFKGEITELQ